MPVLYTTATTTTASIAITTANLRRNASISGGRYGSLWFAATLKYPIHLLFDTWGGPTPAAIGVQAAVLVH